ADLGAAEALAEALHAGRLLTFSKPALLMVLGWANRELFPHLAPLRDEDGKVLEHQDYPEKDAPGWLVSKYHKLFENCLRLCLVFHELWRVSEEAELWREGANRTWYGRPMPFDEKVVDCATVERAIAVVEYFKGHIGVVQELFGEVEVD